jgi:tetratricopeptide (TPR) repeat protein
VWPFKKTIRLDQFSREEHLKLLHELGAFACQRPVDPALSGAIEKLESAVEREPEFVFMFNLCDAYMDAERYVDALHLAERMVDTWPTDPRPTYALATIYNTLGRERASEYSEEQLHAIDRVVESLADERLDMPVTVQMCQLDFKDQFALMTYDALDRERTSKLSEEQLGVVHLLLGYQHSQWEDMPVSMRPGPATSAMEVACGTLGLLVRDVRERAVQYLRKTLEFDLDGEDRRSVQGTLDLAERALKLTGTTGR